ncbi:SNF5 family protein [Abortiporus biennis]
MSDAGSLSNATSSAFQNMSDSQLRQAISQLSSAAGRASQPPATPVNPSVYYSNIRQWSVSSTPPPTNGRIPPPRTRSRAARQSSTAPTPAPQQPIAYHSSQPETGIPTQIPVGAGAYNDGPIPGPSSRTATHIPSVPQAKLSTYASRLRTGATLLMQPILISSSTAAITTRSTRRGGVVNYAEPGSGDEFPDAGALDSDDSDFVASGGTRSAVRSAGGMRLSSRAPVGAGVFHAGSSTPSVINRAPPPPPPPQKKDELDQSYLGMIPPAKFIVARPVDAVHPRYYPQEVLDMQALRPTSLVPVRVEFETDTHRIRDCFVWNIHENLIEPEQFAKTFCADLDLPPEPWVETIANQIRAQLEEHEGVVTVDLRGEGWDEALPEEELTEVMEVDGERGVGERRRNVEEVQECRVMLSIDVQIATFHLLDHIEWDLLSPLTPEHFARTLCADLGLTGEAVPLIAHAIHEELIKHKRDAIEWGVITSSDVVASNEEGDKPRDRSGYGLMKDKTGLGLGWGRAPKDGRGPKPLKSVWRDWADAEEFRTRFEVLTADEVERREIEKERASRRLRRETSKFQSQASTRRRYR